MELLIGVIVLPSRLWRSFGHVAASPPAGTPRKKRIMKFQKGGGHRGTTAAPCVLSPAFGGRGMGS
jgi:hypothetical protein